VRVLSHPPAQPSGLRVLGHGKQVSPAGAEGCLSSKMAVTVSCGRRILGLCAPLRGVPIASEVLTL
jgi:hypothetical protein